MARSKSVVRLHTTIDLGPVMNLSSPPLPVHDAVIDGTPESDDLGFWATPPGPVDVTLHREPWS